MKDDGVSWVPVKQRSSTYMKRKYGITERTFGKMLQAQRHRCAICETPFLRTDDEKRPAIDHDHETGFVRGLLCVRCNAGLGQFQDSVELLEKAIAYLKHSRGLT